MPAPGCKIILCLIDQRGPAAVVLSARTRQLDGDWVQWGGSMKSKFNENSDWKDQNVLVINKTRLVFNHEIHLLLK